MARLGAQDTQIPRISDRVFENIVVGGQRLTNAVVFSKTATHVMLSHAQGLTGMRIEDLDAATLRLLGYAVEDNDTGVGGPSGWRPLDGFLSMLSDAFDLNENRWYSMAGIVIFACMVMGFYLYTSYLFWLICLKTETTPGISVWLPFFQAIPLLRAARMSGAWAFALLALSVGAAYLRLHTFRYALWCELGAAFLCVALWAAWSVRICQARKKSPLVAILLLIPGMNYFALLYVAGSK
jgi:hypothetical protein